MPGGNFMYSVRVDNYFQKVGKGTRKIKANAKAERIDRCERMRKKGEVELCKVGNCKNFKNKMYLKLGKLTIAREVQQENKKDVGINIGERKLQNSQ
jgi:hypothetical protein